MRNRAKCRLCGDILESFHQHDYVTCKCGEISIDGGSYYFRASATDFSNFLRIDDEGREIAVEYEDKSASHQNGKEIDTVENKEKPPSHDATNDIQDLIQAVDEMIKNIENLPLHAQCAPLTQYDEMRMLLLIQRILKLIDEKTEVFSR